ncbi:NAD(P)H-hydrate dehydratase [Halarcobacter ebronensis]|uniref:Bifunctional NAD(P)H-hydrate repair enzyme n=1 Tax=Halarcobacter ebronensis TaxID=1462615 RepID=A0A4Q1AYY9_9BACT|nr:NAD(P)H-hydrate dehydratase [Halarcobacter ebronensis]QKF80841.1 carbohydrate kinase, YjeF-related protein [Halarcobacter ebronensis]RXK08631.1 bifunctional ADP-dependent NAD(P)H-hydrate dehydratase/NAD(P)H-hydrate epimerase [Halarcobacter ebronensis]
MQNLYYEVGSLDKRCYEKFSLTEDLLMEHAASNIQEEIEKRFKKGSSVLIVCGSGNNGADGIALARLLYKKYEVKLYIAFELKSKMAKLQLQRAELLGLKTVDELSSCDVVVDCLFGTGLNKDLDRVSQELIENLNGFDSFKIACDIPSGINPKGEITTTAFFADLTVTMGALKQALYSDMAKDYIGEVKVANLGVQREVYEIQTNVFLLDKGDLKLPLRDKKDAHKGSFGHLNVIAGCKKGAGVIAAKAAFGFGAGLVSVICHDNIDLPYHIMQTHKLAQNCTAIAIGMGLGLYDEKEIKEILNTNLPMIIDADLFHENITLNILEKEVVLTPHPKEFCSLLKLCNLADIKVEELQRDRFFYVKEFCKKYPKVVLLLKGANVLIAQKDKIYVNPLGSAVLSKGGSGDVLSGLVGALLAQGYSAIDAAIHASLAHTIAASNYKKNNYSLIPSDLIEEVKKL